MSILAYAVTLMVGFYLLCAAATVLLMAAGAIKRAYEIVVFGK